MLIDEVLVKREGRAPDEGIVQLLVHGPAMTEDEDPARPEERLHPLPVDRQVASETIEDLRAEDRVEQCIRSMRWR